MMRRIVTAFYRKSSTYLQSMKKIRRPTGDLTMRAATAKMPAQKPINLRMKMSVGISDGNVFLTADLDGVGVAQRKLGDGIGRLVAHRADDASGKVLTTFHLNLGDCRNATEVTLKDGDGSGRTTGRPHGLPLIASEVTDEELADGVHGAEECDRLL